MTFKVEVDISQVKRRGRQARASFKAMPDRFLAIATQAAAEELASKSYTNRTGDLAGGTEATLASLGPGFFVTLKMGEFYGVYVQALGYSDFDKHAIRAGVGIDNYVRAMGRRLSK